MSPPPKSAASISQQFGDLFEQIPPPQRIWLLTGGMVVLTLFLGLTFIQGPWSAKRRRLAHEIQQERQRSELLMELRTLQKDLSQTHEALILRGGATELTRMATDLAAQTGLEIESVNPQPPTLHDRYKKLQIRLVARAGYPELVAYLRAVETHRPLLKINELEMEQMPEAFERGRRTTPLRGPNQTSEPYTPSSDHRVELTLSAWTWNR